MRTVLTRNSQVTLVVNVFSVAKITQYLFRFRRVLSYVHYLGHLTGCCPFHHHPGRQTHWNRLKHPVHISLLYRVQPSHAILSRDPKDPCTCVSTIGMKSCPMDIPERRSRQQKNSHGRHMPYSSITWIEREPE